MNMLLRTRLSLITLLSAALAAALVGELIWQLQRQHEVQVGRLLLSSQKQAWERMSSETAQQLEAISQRLAQDLNFRQAATEEQRQDALRRLDIRTQDTRAELFDQLGRRLLPPGDAEDTDSILTDEAVSRVTQGEVLAGFGQLYGQRYRQFSARLIDDTRVLVVSTAVADRLDQMRDMLEGEVFLVGLRGREIAGSRPGLLAETGNAPMTRHDSVRLVTAEGRERVLVSSRFSGWDGRPLATLSSLREISALRAEGNTGSRDIIGLTLLGGAVFAAFLWFYLRRALAPIDHGVDQLGRLAGGDTSLDIDDAASDTVDEIGRIRDAITHLREEMLNLALLKEEKLRIGKVQTRIIRDELQKLATVLDPQIRSEVAAALNGADDPHERNELTHLSRVLARLTGLIGSQHGRLLALLDDLRAALVGKEALARLQRELEIASRIQSLILPREPLHHPAATIAATMIPAEEVGGDFYDYFLLNEHTLALVIADVSGKGIPAAFFMAVARTSLRAYAEFMTSARGCIERLNNQLCLDNEEMMFVTLFFAVVDLNSGATRYVNAGHNPPAHLTETVTLLPRGHNPALAVVDGIDYSEGRLQLHAGDVLFLYTDGVTEATDVHQQLFGEAAMIGILQRQRHDADLPEHLVDAIRAFEQGARQADDITMLSLTYLGPTQAGGKELGCIAQ